MEKRIGVVIPFIDPVRIFNLTDMICSNTVYPDRIVLIEDTKKPVDIDIQYPITVLRIEPSPGVNDSWMIGAAACGNVDYLTFLNDDILITPRFFERLKEAIQSVDLGAICPLTVSSESFSGYKTIEREGPELQKMKHTEGWAFTIKREIFQAAMPFPEGMIHFAGDNWLWWITYEQFKMKWFKDMNNLIYHQVGASQTKETRSRLKEDHSICSKALQKRFPERHAAGARKKRHNVRL